MAKPFSQLYDKMPSEAKARVEARVQATLLEINPQEPVVENPTMKCRNCNRAELTSTRENHLYTASGLPNVVLVDVEVRRCPECGHDDVVIPRVEELFRTLACAVVRKPSRLSDAEVGFLLKHLGASEADLAEHVRVDPVVGATSPELRVRPNANGWELTWPV